MVFINEIESIAIKNAGIEYDKSTKPKESFNDFEDFRIKFVEILRIILNSKENIDLITLRNGLSILTRFCRSAKYDYFQEESIVSLIYESGIVQNLVDVIDINERKIESAEYELILSNILRKCIRIITILLDLRLDIHQILTEVCFIDRILIIWKQQLFDTKALKCLFILFTKYLRICDTEAFTRAFDIGFIGKCCEILYHDTEDERKQHLQLTILLANYFSRFTYGKISQPVMTCFEKFIDTLGLDDTSFDQRQVLYSVLWKWIQARIISSSFIITHKVENKRVFLFLVNDVTSSFRLYNIDHTISQFAALQLLTAFYSDSQMIHNGKFETLQLIKFNVLATAFDRDSPAIDLVCHFLYVLTQLDLEDVPPETRAKGSFFQYIMGEQHILIYILESLKDQKMSIRNQKTCVMLLSLLAQRENADEYSYMYHNGLINTFLDFLESDEQELQFFVVKGLLSFAKYFRAHPDAGWDYFSQLCEEAGLQEVLLEHKDDESPEFYELYATMNYSDDM